MLDRWRRNSIPKFLITFLTIILPFALAVAAIAADAGPSANQSQNPVSPSPAPESDPLAQAESDAQQAITLLRRGLYADAEPLLNQALAAREKVLGPDHPEVATTLNYLAGVYQEQGRYGKAEPLYRRALTIRQKAYGRDAPEIAPSLNNLGVLLTRMGRYQDAEPLLRHALALKELAAGADDPDVARSLNNLAQLDRLLARYAEAERYCKRAQAILEKALGPDHPDVATSLNNLAELYRIEGRYGDAEPLYRRALAIREKAVGLDHPAVAASLNNLADLLRAQGRYAEAEPLYQQALAIRDNPSGAESPDLATSLNDLAELYLAQGRDGEAERLYRRALAIREKALGSDHPDVAQTLDGIAALHRAQGQYGEAESLYRRALGIQENALGADHPELVETLNSLAALCREQGRYGEAEPLLQRVVAIRERMSGPDNRDVFQSLNNLAFLYIDQGRDSDAEQLFRRALAVEEKTPGSKPSDLAASLNNLAILVARHGRYAEAEPLLQRALTSEEKALGPDHPDLAKTLTNLAVLDRALRRDSEPLYRRALAIREKALGPDHPDVATSLSNLAALLAAQHRYDEAEPLYARAVAIREKTLGPRSAELAANLNDLAEINRAEGKTEAALAVSARAVAIQEENLLAGVNQGSATGLLERNRDRLYFTNYVSIAHAAAESTPEKKTSPTDHAFRVAQFAHASGASWLLAGIAPRLATGTDALATGIRERQNLTGQWQQLDSAIVSAAGRKAAERDQAEDRRLRAAFEETALRLEALDAQIARNFPAYAELANPKPVSIEAAQSLLGGDEALLVYLTGDRESWLWAIRRDTAALYRLALGAKALSEQVSALRERLDPARNPNLGPFPAVLAYDLYQKILAPAAPLLDGVHHLLIVPDGPLQSLPLGVLITKTPNADPQQLEANRDIAWLARDYAVAFLPSVSSLRTLRKRPIVPTASTPFLGIAPRSLPGRINTTEELRGLAKALGTADDTDLLIGGRANERTLVQMALEGFRIIDFAAPLSLAAGPKAEPALALSPTEESDGSLTASKIAGLRLNADWVILSAGNTAGPDGSPDGEGLPAIEKAFFFAGAHAVLLTHWRAPSTATVTLITGTFAELAEHPSIGGAEALRRSMIGMLDPSSPPEFAHPAAWGAFVIAGDGGAPRAD